MCFFHIENLPNYPVTLWLTEKRKLDHMSVYPLIWVFLVDTKHNNYISFSNYYVIDELLGPVVWVNNEEWNSMFGVILSWRKFHFVRSYFRPLVFLHRSMSFFRQSAHLSIHMWVSIRMRVCPSVCDIVHLYATSSTHMRLCLLRRIYITSQKL